MGLPVLDAFRFPAEREAMISPKGCSWGESIPEQICLVYGGHRQSPDYQEAEAAVTLNRTSDTALWIRPAAYASQNVPYRMKNYSNVLKLELRAGRASREFAYRAWKVADRQALSFPSGANFMNRPMGWCEKEAKGDWIHAVEYRIYRSSCIGTDRSVVVRPVKRDWQGARNNDQGVPERRKKCWKKRRLVPMLIPRQALMP